MIFITSLPRANFPIVTFFLVRSKSDEMLYLFGDGERVFLAISIFFPRPIPGLGDLPIDDGML